MDSPDLKPPSILNDHGLKDTFTETVQTPGRLLKIISGDNDTYAVSYPVTASLNLIRVKPEFTPPEELIKAKSMFSSEADQDKKRVALTLQREGLKKLDEQNAILANKSRWPVRQTKVDDIESTGRGSYFSYDLNGDSISTEDWKPTDLVQTDDENPGSESGADPQGDLFLDVLVTKGQIFINEASEAVTLKDLVITGILAFGIGNQEPKNIVALSKDVCSRLEAQDLFSQIKQSDNKKADPAKITSGWMSKLSKVIIDYDKFRKSGVIV